MSDHKLRKAAAKDAMVGQESEKIQDSQDHSFLQQHVLNKKDVIMTNFQQEIDELLPLKQESKDELMECLAMVDHFLTKKIKLLKNL